MLDDVILDIKEPKDSLAIYIEEYDTEGNASYVESEYSTFPIEDYVYNKELSGCLDSNSNEVEDALNYNYVDKELNLRVNKPVICYVYYDYKGNGTEKVPYKIRSIEDLLDLSQSVNLGETYTGKYFELTRDLDFNDSNSYNDSERTDYGNLNGITNDGNMLMKELTTGTGWVPIGTTSEISFQGIFNGNNKKINNLYQERNDGGGLFLYINNATLKNLTLNGEVTANVSDVGGFAAKNYGNTIIDNCHNEVNVTSLVNKSSAGGLVGGSAGDKIIIKNSSNKGNISGSNNVGGLIGTCMYNLTIEDSYNEGTLTNSLGQYAGGLLGRDNAPTNTTTILNSYNNGEVIANGDERYAAIGGLVGKINGNVYINNSYNSEVISSEIDGWLGGLIGRNEGKTVITKSKNKGNITGGTRVGGIVGIGFDNKSIVIIDKSYNSGILSSLKGGAVVGGISSFAWNGAQFYIFNSYNYGDISNSSTGGGIVAIISNNNSLLNVVNSYNMGNILNTNISTTFGILNEGTLKLDNVYTIGSFKNVTTKYGIGQFTGQNYNVTKAYYKSKAEDGSDISGSNITSDEIIGKNLNEMQSDNFVAELNNNIDNIILTEYIDNDLLTEFENTAGYKLTLSKWQLKDNHPILGDLEGI